MKTLGNIVWLVFGGMMMGLEYLISGVAIMLTIIGIPFGLQALKFGMLAMWPFGSSVVKKEQAPGCINSVMNVLWFFIGGFPIFLTHVLWGVLFSITIIGIPFGKQHFKLAHIALVPFGREIVSN